MLIIKTIILTLIFLVCFYIGMSIAKKYTNRVNELKIILSCLNIFEEKIKFTYEPVPDVFLDISKMQKNEIGNLFYNAQEKMKTMFAGEAWEEAIDESKTNLNKEDIEILKGLAKMLGKIDLDGQVNEIRLTKKFIETKIKEAEYEKNKNEKLYKTLGATIGLIAIVILA